MRIKVLFYVALMSFSIMGNFAASADSAQGAKSLPANRVIVYYFHGNFRCVNCRNIEQFSKEAAEKYFKDELASGKVVFEVVNVEEKENEHFVDDYQLYAKALVILQIKDGKENQRKNLTKIWEYVRNEDRFVEYVTNEIRDYLKE